MSLKAIAYHHAISPDKLEALFTSEWNQLFATTTFVRCTKCGTLYAVFLPAADDAENGRYVADVEDRISKDCDGGKHSLSEIRLDVKP